LDGGDPEARYRKDNIMGLMCLDRKRQLVAIARSEIPGHAFLNVTGTLCGRLLGTGQMYLRSFENHDLRALVLRTIHSSLINRPPNVLPYFPTHNLRPTTMSPKLADSLPHPPRSLSISLLRIPHIISKTKSLMSWV